MRGQVFSHEKLHVYQKSLAFVAEAERLLVRWDKKHAIVDHLSRATESTVVNIAEGSRTKDLSARQVAIDYSVGSALECAACLDIAAIKRLLPAEEALDHKKRLAEIVRMLIGLRRSWESQGVGEEEAVYRLEPSSGTDSALFYHERLDVYQVGLSFMRWFCADGVADGLNMRLFRKLDQTATSLILNVAEGNGRFAKLDHSRFLKHANAATIKLAAFLDVCIHRGDLAADDIGDAKHLLLRIANMTAAMAGLK